MGIRGIDTLTFGVTDLGRTTQFLADWGLKRVRADTSSAAYRCVAGNTVVVKPIDAPDLPAAIEPGSTLREIIWGVSTKRDLDAIATELGRDRKVTVDRAGVVRSVDDMGLAIGFRISTRKPAKAPPVDVNTPGRPLRIDRTAPFYARATPLEFSHVVFGVPDFKIVERFYTKRLGFLVSDRYVGRSVFMRASPTGNHHHLFVMNSADQNVHFNHVCFKVRDVHEVIGGGQYITGRGWETQVGPGRHFPSSAIFWYFKSPLGGAFEYAADEDVVTAKWKPRTFKVAPELFNEWRFHAPAGMAGAPMAASRSA